MRILGWVVFGLLAMPAYANEKVERIIDAMGVQVELEAAFSELKPYQQDFSKSEEDEVTLLLRRHQKEDLALFEKYFSWASIQPELVRSFEEIYTTEEISAIYKFVKSQHGRGYFAKLGALGDQNQTIFAGIYQEYESEWKPLSDTQSQEVEQLAKKLEAEQQPLPEPKVYPNAPTSIGDIVRFMVATENGEMIGYKVRPGRSEDLFQKSGFQKNDIAVSVNGLMINDPEAVRDVYHMLKKSRQVLVEVQRGDEFVDFVIDLDEIESVE